MFVANKKLTNEWAEITEVNTGNTFLIQNIMNKEVFFCVSETTPEAETIGGVLLPYQQLSFKKVNGNMYMRKDWSGNASVCLSIEKVEA